MDQRMRNSLDKWITGNYGEDQFKGMDKCPNCGETLTFDLHNDIWWCSHCKWSEEDE